MRLYDLHRGDSALVVDVPHAGTHVPQAIADAMDAGDATALPDTDWHVEKLYAGVARHGAGLLVATHSRYVVDLNRDPAGKPLYPGADNTEVVPARSFANHALWSGAGPSQGEIAERIRRYWQPYHDALAAEVARLKQRFGVVVLWDGHSIASEVPRFFEGKLPDLNLGTAKGTSCSDDLAARAWSLVGGSTFTAVRDGRFTGGYITRHYGSPSDNVNALQLEVAQSAYMDEATPQAWNEARGAECRGHPGEQDAPGFVHRRRRGGGGGKGLPGRGAEQR
jgi:N-formylglutamate deformylase